MALISAQNLDTSQNNSKASKALDQLRVSLQDSHLVSYDPGWSWFMNYEKTAIRLRKEHAMELLAMNFDLLGEEMKDQLGYIPEEGAGKLS